MTDGKTGARLKVLAVLCAFMFAALGTRLWFVQVLAQEQAEHSARLNSTRTQAIPAPRGRILDRNGAVLARSRASLVVTVNREQLPPDATGEIARLADVLGFSVKHLTELINTDRYYSFTPVPVAFDVPKTTYFYLGEHRSEFQGVNVQEQTVRDYLHGELAAHLIGYVGPVSQEQLNDPRYHDDAPDDIVGKSGVEVAYEQYLRGTKGSIMYQVDSSGRNLGPVGHTPAVAGDDVFLTIDQKVQHLAEVSLGKGIKAARTFGLKATAGAVIVMDPNSGAMPALASWPTFNPSVFATGNSREINKLFPKDASSKNPCPNGCPIFDRATQATYPPGSTFKPFVALSALRRGYAKMKGPHSAINCPAAYQVPGTEGEEPPKENWEPVDHGYISLAHALVISCDTVFYQLGWRNWTDWYNYESDDNHPVVDKLQNDLRTLGFGRPTGLDVPGEKSGVIPDAAFKAEHYADSPDKYAKNWQPGDFINMSIGQGDVAVTPMQLATAYSALANGGTVYRPHLVEKVTSANGETVVDNKPVANGHLPFTQKQLDYVRNALTGVVGPEGTASSAFATFPKDRIPIAAKTGTAEVNPFEPYSWFAAMAPANAPQYVVVAIVEQGGHGSQSAAPIVRRILDGLFDLPLTEPTTGSRSVD
ncbi:MAG TPA: penicillin-binding protein 2 [Actinomycetota bacterium]